MSDNYKVGRGKPPKHSQFKPGVSGNKHGRPRKPRPSASGTSQLSAKLLEHLRREVRGVEDGKQVTLSMFDLIAKRHINAAANGTGKDLKALVSFFEIIERSEAAHQAAQPDRLAILELPSDPIEAERIYREIMGS